MLQICGHVKEDYGETITYWKYYVALSICTPRIP